MRKKVIFSQNSVWNAVYCIPMARIPHVISASQSMLLRFGDPLDERQNSAENGLR